MEEIAETELTEERIGDVSPIKTELEKSEKSDEEKKDEGRLSGLRNALSSVGSSVGALFSRTTTMTSVPSNPASDIFESAISICSEG